MDADAVDNGDPEFEEKDPTGRYGRYNEILGKGAFKTVYRAFDEIEGMEVAWNQVKLRDVMKQSEDLERLFSEVHLLKTLKHQNIIKFYNSWVDTENDNINFITEIFTSGTLRQYRKKHKHVDMRALKNWSRQILRGLLYLHSHDPPIIHRDLKCDNIFVNGNQGQVKIGDLGLAAILRRTHAAHSVIGTPEFMAPELYEEEYDELVDIYSFGMCLLEMVTFEYPYSECANAAQIYKKVTAGIKPAALGKVKDPEVREFVEKCIASASSRLPAKELLRDPFLQNESLNDVRWSYIHETDYPREQLATVREEYSSGNSMSPENAVRVGISLNTNANADDGCEHVDDSLEDETNPWDKLNRDFTVKGQRKHANTVFLTLRMVDSEGYVRNIHFPFDIAFDTATGVAREMVTELDLSDQDVTNIAAMIDAEIQALVPDWEPGEPLDDDDVSVERNAQYDIAALADDVHQLLKDADPAAEHGSYVLERFPSGRHFWSDSPKLLARPSLSTALMDPSKKGLRPTRSEEIKIHCDFSATDNVKDEQDDSKNYVNSILAAAVATAPSLVKGTCVVRERRSQSCTEFEKMSDNDNDTETHHEIPNISRHVSAGNHRDNCSSAATTIGMEANLMESLSVVQNADVENMISRNFQRLILTHEEELEGLKRKHKEEIQHFLNDQLKMGFSKGLLKKLLPLTYLVELNEAGNKEID